jgi:hypothetical protein
MVDSITMKRLVIIKQIFSQGKEQQQKHTQTGNMLACHHYDMSIEMLLRMICTDLNIKLKLKEDGFWRIWELVNTEVQKKFKADLPLMHEIEALRNARNSIQHAGTVPSDSDVERFEGYAITFLEDTIKKVFLIDFEEIKLSELIKDTILKGHVISAEDLINQNDFLNAVEKLTIAFELGKIKAIHNIYESDWSKILKPFGFREIEAKIGLSAKKELDEAFKKTEEMLSMLALKLDYRDYLNFKKKSFYVTWSLGSSEPRVMRVGTEVRTKEDANFCYNFVFNSFITWEL